MVIYHGIHRFFRIPYLPPALKEILQRHTVFDTRSGYIASYERIEDFLRYFVTSY